MIISWDSSYENIPTSGLQRNYIDDVLREIKFAIRERMEIEHEWGPFSTKDDGSHRLGLTSVADAGSSAPSGAHPGALYLRNDGGDLRLFMYFDPAGGTDYSWNMITTKDHAQLTNRSLVSAHSVYLPLSNGTVTGDIDMGGYHFRTGAPASTWHSTQDFGGAVLYRHKNRAHPTFGGAAIPALTAAHIRTSSGRSSIYSLPNNTAVQICSGWYNLFPEVHVEHAQDDHISFLAGLYGISLKNNSGSAVWVRDGVITL